MKLTTLLFVLVSLTTQAQISQGRWQVSADLSDFSYKVNDANTSFSGQLTPAIGYVLVQNLVAGVGLSLNHYSTSTTTVFREHTSSIGASPYIRYYVGKASLKPFVGISYSFFTNKDTFTIYGGAVESYSRTFSSNALTPALGLAYFLNNRFALQASLHYVMYMNEAGGPVGLNGPNTSFLPGRSNHQDLSLGLGIQFLLGR